jgi:hypothetical protein
MRDDMFEVIIERPRSGRSWAEPLRTPEDDRTWMPVSRRRGSKQLNENLAPLRRYLRGNVGRPWDAVYADICRNLSVRSAVQKHVRDHLRDFVLVHVEERDGALWGGRFERRELVRGHRDQLYVCPRTGLLKLLAGLPHKLRRTRQSQVTWVGPAQAALVFRDQWLLVDVAPVVAWPAWDAVLGQAADGSAQYGSWRLRQLYGRDCVAGVRKRALTRAEVKRLGLRRGHRARRPA